MSGHGLPATLARNVIQWRFPGGNERTDDSYGPAGPTIRFKDLDDSQKAYFDTIYLEGNIQGAHPITKLTLNGESLLKREGTNLFFGIFWKLQPGDNELVFLAEDDQGRSTERRIHIEYLVPRVLTLESRLRVFVIPFQPVRCETTLGEYVSQHLIFSLVEQERFYVVNREALDRTLLEQHLGETGLVDPRTAVKVGRIAKAEEALVGTVYEGRKSVEIFAQMIDTETSEILLEKDVFHEDKSPERLRNMTEGLALKFKHAMPLIQGNILKLEGSQLYADIGTEERIRKGARLVVFREKAELVDPETGRTMGCETEELGEAIIQKVDEGRSIGEFRRNHSCNAVNLNDRVITK
jgi:TolB-like protein